MTSFKSSILSKILKLMIISINKKIFICSYIFYAFKAPVDYFVNDGDTESGVSKQREEVCVGGV